MLNSRWFTSRHSRHAWGVVIPAVPITDNRAIKAAAWVLIWLLRVNLACDENRRYHESP